MQTTLADFIGEAHGSALGVGCLRRCNPPVQLDEERRGARRVDASSIYVRDPDGNLLEFMTY